MGEPAFVVAVEAVGVDAVEDSDGVPGPLTVVVEAPTAGLQAHEERTAACL